MARALACVNLFLSVGVEKFAATMLQDAKPIGKRVTLYEHFGNNEVLRSIPSLVNRNWTFAESLILRPVCSHLIQLDDCDLESIERLRPFAFSIVETSSGNYQVWLALPAETNKDERDQIRSQLFKVLEGIDKSASGAMRWPGSINHKADRNSFCVRIVEGNLGRFVTPAELDAAGLFTPLATTGQVSRQSVQHHQFPGGHLQWPDYERCLREAPIKGDGLPDRSKADNSWCILALGRGWSETAVESKLCELSEKARVRADYARLTVTYAASIVARSEGIGSVFAGALQPLRSGNHEHVRA